VRDDGTKAYQQRTGRGLPATFPAESLVRFDCPARWKKDSEILTMFLFMRKNEESNSPNREGSPAANKSAFTAIGEMP
jgi:hypothetical protein